MEEGRGNILEETWKDHDKAVIGRGKARKAG